MAHLPTQGLATCDPRHRQDLGTLIEAMPAARHLGIRVAGFLPNGTSRIELTVRKEHRFDGRTVQAGVLGALADYAGVSAAAATLPAGWMASTVGYEVHNVAPASGLELVAIGYAKHVGRTSAVSQVEVYAMDPGPVLVCLAQTTCRPMQLESCRGSS